jgi:hypothetical protein
VTAYQPLIASLTVPDPNDRHVLAAAIVGRCDAIVAQNLIHFPEAALAASGVEAQHKDGFLARVYLQRDLAYPLDSRL